MMNLNKKQILNKLKRPAKSDLPELINFRELENDLLDIFKIEAERIQCDIYKCNNINELTSTLEQAGVNLEESIISESAHRLIKNDNNTVYSTKLSHSELAAYKYGITVPDYAIAYTGSLIEINTIKGDRRLSVLPEIHIAIVFKNKLVATLTDCLMKMTLDSNYTIISGPSRTADIEKRIVIGAHGPKQLKIILVGEEKY